MEPLALDPADPLALLAAVDALRGGTVLRTAAAAVDEPVHLVGGAVRDLLTGREPRELDVAVEGQAGALIAALGGTAVDEHERFGTATVHLPGGATVDVAQTRAEQYAEPGALPAVEPAPLAIDLHRRDVTLNAIAIDLRTGELHAPGTALADLRQRVLRVLHPKSFVDDPTRLWRLARYEVRLGADWDPVTWHLAGAGIAGGAIETVSRQRMASELRLALREPDPIGALAAAARLGLPPRVDLDALRLHQAEELAAEADVPAAELVLAAVASDDPLLPLHLERQEERDLIAAALGVREDGGWAGRPGPLPADAPGSEVRRRFEGVPRAAVAAAPDAGPAGWWLADLRHRRLAIGGDELLAAGVPQGAALGRGLAAARDALLDGRVAPGDADAQLLIATQAAGPSAADYR